MDHEEANNEAAATAPGSRDKLLFWACFIALIATSTAFIVRVLLIYTDWAEEFDLTQTQQGEIFGVGLWPFAISIILFSLIIDKVGYGKAMIFAFACHVVSAVVTIMADGYWSLYWATFIVALGNGTVEAVINPVVATMFPREKAKWLNILHAGWPGGLVVGGIIVIGMGDMAWEYKVALILIPTVIYGAMMLATRFPVNERVAAGVSYKEMLREFGALGAYIVSAMIVLEVGRVLAARGLLFQGWEESTRFWTSLAIAAIPAVAFGVYVRALGRPLFIFLLLIMIPLATTELGTDSWITSLMAPAMEEIGIAAGWVLVYTSFIMMVLRLFAAGPIVDKLTPLGLLAVSAVVAAVGLLLLSQVTAAVTILLAATVYGFGKSFFWPTMLGVVAEQSPKGGALTLNATGGVGMLGVGVLGAVFIGYVQDTAIEGRLEANQPAIHEQVVTEKAWVFGQLEAVDPALVDTLPEPQQQIVTEIETDAKRNALATVAILPGIMLVCYLFLIIYFKSKGGYTAEVLVGDTEKALDEKNKEEEKFSGGVAGPAGH